MRVGVFLDHWMPDRGGAERCFGALIETLIARGDEVLVFGLTAKPGAPGRFRRVPVRKLPRGSLERALADGQVAAAREAACDVTIGMRHLREVDVYWPHGGLHAATLRAGEQSRGGVGTQGAMLMHLLSPKHKTFLALEAELLGPRTPDGRGAGARVIWCVSELVRHEIVAAYPDAASRIEVHPNGVALQHFQPDLRRMLRVPNLMEIGFGVDSKVLLFMGGNWRLKGWRTFLDALGQLPGDDWVALAAGGDPGDALRDVARAKLEGRVKVVPPRDPRGLYACADVLVQPTWRDPCSLATLEALACGVPVVTTTENGAADAFGATGAGTVIAPGDPQALADALRWRLDSLAEPEGAQSIRAAARAAGETRPREGWIDGLVASLERAAATRS